MLVVYALEEPPAGYEQALTLLGPLPVTSDDEAWIPAALDALRELGYQGVVFVPQFRDMRPRKQIDTEAYVRLLEWQAWTKKSADVLAEWFPAHLVGRNSLAELAEWRNSGKLVVGVHPARSDAASLLRLAGEAHVPTAETLRQTLANALHLMGKGAWREKGEREVPLMVWRTASFQQWLTAQRQAGNVLHHATLLWNLRVGDDGRIVFFWVLHVELYIAREGRYKTNEVILSRPNISAVVLYRPAATLDDTIVALVREARAPVSNPTGYVWELPSGSSPGLDDDPLERIISETRQETGLQMVRERVRRHLSRQLIPTVSAHWGDVHSYELTEEELERLLEREGVPQGVAEDTERTYVVVTTLGAIQRKGLVGWTDIGMLLYVLSEVRGLLA